MGDHPVLAAISLRLICAASLAAQAAPTTVTVTAVPRLIRITGSFRPAGAQPAAAVEGATLAIYLDETGGVPLWQETQNVQVEADGRYTVTMGSTSNEGVPLELFLAGEPRWLGVQFNRPGEVEQPRVRLASVPYALKASDADTLGGRPPSAYMLTPEAQAGGGAGEGGTTASGVVRSTKASQTTPQATSGTTNTIAMFTNSTDLGNSVMYQSGGRIGLGTTMPGDALHVAVNDGGGVLTGLAVQNLSWGPAAYSGMLFYDQVGRLSLFQGFNNSTHEYRINNIASAAQINFMIWGDSKLVVNNNGIGIGTLAPGSKLDVEGDVNVRGALRLLGKPMLRLPGGFQTNNIALGQDTLAFNTTGASNIAAGASALGDNTTGSGNLALGNGALQLNTVGLHNTAVGNGAMVLNRSGFNNIAVGYQSGFNVTTQGNNIHIGSAGVSGDSGTIRIGTPGTQTSFFAAGVRGVTTTNNDASAVVIDSNGQLGTISSSRRFKEDIRDMGDVSDGLMRLRPVTFRYTKPYGDGSKPIQYGLIAEEVAEVYPDLVARSADGQIETVKYQVLDALLLNEVQKQSHQIRGLEEKIAERDRQITEQGEQNRLLQERLARLESVLATVSADAVRRQETAGVVKPGSGIKR